VTSRRRPKPRSLGFARTCGRQQNWALAGNRVKAPRFACQRQHLGLRLRPKSGTHAAIYPDGPGGQGKIVGAPARAPRSCVAAAYGSRLVNQPRRRGRLVTSSALDRIPPIRAKVNGPRIDQSDRCRRPSSSGRRRRALLVRETPMGPIRESNGRSMPSIGWPRTPRLPISASASRTTTTAVEALDVRQCGVPELRFRRADERHIGWTCRDRW